MNDFAACSFLRRTATRASLSSIGNARNDMLVVSGSAGGASPGPKLPIVQRRIRGITATGIGQLLYQHGRGKIDRDSPNVVPTQVKWYLI